MTPGQAEQVQAAIAQQERANNRIVMAALLDEKFIVGVLEAREAEKNGNKGDLLADVTKRLKLV